MSPAKGQDPYSRLHFDGLPESPSKLFFYERLPPAQRRFVDELIVCQEITKSAERVGLSPTSATLMMKTVQIRCAIRERLDTITDMASVTAAEIRHELKQILHADPTEITGVWRVPCRHCWGEGNHYQYTDPEFHYLEQAFSYGENGWPSACITNEFGALLFKHAIASWISGKNHLTVDVKGGSGYTRNREINGDCPQCHGLGEPMVWVCDTRRISEKAKKIFKGVKLGDQKLEVLTIDKTQALTLLARDTQVGVERHEINIGIPRTREELEATIKKMSATELEAFVGNMIELGEGEFELVTQAQLPHRRRRYTRGT